MFPITAAHCVLYPPPTPGMGNKSVVHKKGLRGLEASGFVWVPEKILINTHKLNRYFRIHSGATCLPEKMAACLD